ncbi:Acyl-CoA-binding protein, ACBP [Kalmanozyma brasiliensis GHG001]|uniref:Acyl-CoA-binding protein, ACBP n=1 Tax=Kalmanozyma brasiliensis (strain GHG001) TaxID=1365824 RepID=UPI001CEA4D79|nr:Acyl-CoA-binding protein, ACBP [Kalmanozyma brasiliensis GHG001]EST06797.2 Acyl-CoA-binding protein, ACBP [Kalmanozyma brasiliensis GHG001]
MSSADVIDALFVKTVDMVQSLPKSGPIQTSYEEKLALYSLYKQATEGDVSSKRPGMLDMLGRAKWDAWTKVSGLPPRDAKQMYVESMLRILRRYSDRPQASALIQELENFSGQVAQRVMDGSLAQVDSDEESITDTDTDDQQRLDPTGLHQPTSGPSRQSQPNPPRHLAPDAPSVTGTSTAATRGGGGAAISPGRTPMASESEDESSPDDRLGTQPGPFRAPVRHPSSHAPPSVQSYRPQPRAGSISATEGYSRGPPSRSHVSTSAQFERSRGPPSLQGGYSRPQYGPQSTAASVAGSNYPRPGEAGHYQRSTYAASSVGGRSVGTRTGPVPVYPPRPPSNAGTAQRPPRAEMETALQSIQASLAALHERLNRVESRSSAGGADDPRRPNQSSRTYIYNAIMNIVDDVKQLIGLNVVSRGQRTEALAPSFLAEGGAGNKRTSAAVSLLTSPVRILVALVNLSARLALDVISLVLVSSFFLYGFKRITGRGDPLVMIRLLKRLQQAVLRRSPTAKKLVAEAANA